MSVEIARKVIAYFHAQAAATKKPKISPTGSGKYWD